MWEGVFEPLIQGGNVEALACWDPGEKCIPLDSDRIPIDAGATIPQSADPDRNRFGDRCGQAAGPPYAGPGGSSRVDLESQYGLSEPGKSSSTAGVAMLLTKTGSPVQPLSGPYRVHAELIGETLHRCRGDVSRTADLGSRRSDRANLCMPSKPGFGSIGPTWWAWPPRTTRPWWL